MSQHNPSQDEQLIKQCLRGNAQAWNQLVNAYAALVHSIPVRHGLSPVEVEDVSQDVFLALAQHLHQLENPRALPAWLITTARRLSWRAVQKSQRAVAVEPATLNEIADDRRSAIIGSTMPTMEQLLAGWETQELLAQGLQKLGDRCQNLLTLVFLDSAEPSYEEISEQLGISKGSIGPTRTRCLNQLRDILEGLGYVEN